MRRCFHFEILEQGLRQTPSGRQSSVVLEFQKQAINGPCIEKGCVGGVKGRASAQAFPAKTGQGAGKRSCALLTGMVVPRQVMKTFGAKTVESWSAAGKTAFRHPDSRYAHKRPTRAQYTTRALGGFT